MQKWTYTSFHFQPTDSHDTFMSRLEAFGRNGWELVSLEPTVSEGQVREGIFKRPLDVGKQSHAEEGLGLEGLVQSGQDGLAQLVLDLRDEERDLAR